jgi:hypothetical protein
LQQVLAAERSKLALLGTIEDLADRLHDAAGAKTWPSMWWWETSTPFRGRGVEGCGLAHAPCNAAQDRARRLWLVGRLIWIVFIMLVVVTVIYVATATLQSG